MGPPFAAAEQKMGEGNFESRLSHCAQTSFRPPYDVKISNDNEMYIKHDTRLPTPMPFMALPFSTSRVPSLHTKYIYCLYVNRCQSITPNGIYTTQE